MVVPVVIAVAVAMSVAVAVTIAITVIIPVTIAAIVSMRVAVLIALTVVVAVVVPVLGAIRTAVELIFPAAMVVPIRPLSRSRERTTVAVARIEPAIVIATKTYRPCEPRTRANKDAALKPLRPVIAERGAAVRRIVEVPIWACRRLSNIDVDTDLGVCLLRRCR